MTTLALEALTQFGVAGLMGVLWVWERNYSRKREQQLTSAHERLMEDREQLEALIQLVRQNTSAVERFDRTQTHLITILERVEHELSRRAA